MHQRLLLLEIMTINLFYMHMIEIRKLLLKKKKLQKFLKIEL